MVVEAHSVVAYPRKICDIPVGILRGRIVRLPDEVHAVETLPDPRQILKLEMAVSHNQPTMFPGRSVMKPHLREVKRRTGRHSGLRLDTHPFASFSNDEFFRREPYRLRKTQFEGDGIGLTSFHHFRTAESREEYAHRKTGIVPSPLAIVLDVTICLHRELKPHRFFSAGVAEGNAVHLAAKHLESALPVIGRGKIAHLSAIDGKTAPRISGARETDRKTSPQKQGVGDGHLHFHINVKRSVGGLNGLCHTGEIGDPIPLRIRLAADPPTTRTILLRTVPSARIPPCPSRVVHYRRHGDIRVIHNDTSHRGKTYIGSADRQRQQNSAC